jgi:hypothetical protein
MSEEVAERIVGGVFAFGMYVLCGANWSDSRILRGETTDFAPTLYTDVSRLNIGRQPFPPVCHTLMPF